MKKDLYNVFPASIKLINPIQKYSHIIELYACILKVCVAAWSGVWRKIDKEQLINVFISLGICSTPNYQNK